MAIYIAIYRTSSWTCCNTSKWTTSSRLGPTRITEIAVNSVDLVDHCVRSDQVETVECVTKAFEIVATCGKFFDGPNRICWFNTKNGRLRYGNWFIVRQWRWRWFVIVLFIIVIVIVLIVLFVFGVAGSCTRFPNDCACCRRGKQYYKTRYTCSRDSLLLLPTDSGFSYLKVHMHF